MTKRFDSLPKGQAVSVNLQSLTAFDVELGQAGSRHSRPPNSFETSACCRGIGLEKVQLGHLVSPSLGCWPGRFLVG